MNVVARGHAAGTRQPLVDGVEKVTGRAKYSADLPFADAYAGWLTVLAQYNNDFTQAMTDPAAQQAMMALSTPEVEAASQRLGDYMEATCPNS